MDNLNWNQVETIVDEALKLPEDEQQPFVEEQCSDKPELKSRVTTLLESIWDSEGWLENPESYKEGFYGDIAEDVDNLSDQRSLIGQKVGSYTILEKIGEGGMGSVYLAERNGDQFEHRVAIKIVREEQASESNIKRFEQEQRILAGLHHPGIAQLYDGGVTKEGSPYIIMEYVDGIPIDAYSKQQQCTVNQQIDLFKEILEAVRYAHENLIIHRDLKPANILVDQEGRIKILDFGISKLMEEENSQVLTQTGDRLLTPRYAAPEQIKEERITTSTDLYSLGLLFYSLLAGQGPFDFEDCSQYEVEKCITEKQPPKSSKRTNSSAISNKLSGDLDAILLKALRKEPSHRYRTAAEFMDDLENYQHQRPVTARADNSRYRTKMFFKRHKSGITIATIILLLTIGFTAFYSWNITKERNRAELEAQKSENIAQFLTNLFEANNPEQSRGEDVTARELLQRGRKRTDQIEDGALKADMLQTIGVAYLNMSLRDSSKKILDKAEKLIKKVHGENSLEYAGVAFYAAKSRMVEGIAALPYAKKSHQIRRDKLGTLNENTIRSQLKVGQVFDYADKQDSAKYYIDHALEQIKSSEKPNIRLLQKAQGSLATIYNRLGEFDKSRMLYIDLISEEKNKVSVDSLNLADYYHNISTTYIRQHKVKDALPYAKKSVAISESMLGTSHHKTLQTRNNLAGIYSDIGNMERFKELSEQNINYTIQKYGDYHSKTYSAFIAYGLQLTIKKEFEAAEKSIRKALSVSREVFGKDSPTFNNTRAYLAAIFNFKGQKEQSNKLYEETYSQMQQQADSFNHLNRRQIRFLLRLYKSLDPSNSKRIKAYSSLIEEQGNP